MVIARAQTYLSGESSMNQEVLIRPVLIVRKMIGSKFCLAIM